MCKTIPQMRELYARRYSTAKGNWDMFVVFVELVIRLTRNRGVYSFIVPNKLIAAKYAGKLREIIKQGSILEIRDYGSVDVFTNACVYPCTIIASTTNEHEEVSFLKMKDKNDYEIRNSFSSKISVSL